MAKNGPIEVIRGAILDRRLDAAWMFEMKEECQAHVPLAPTCRPTSFVIISHKNERGETLSFSGWQRGDGFQLQYENRFSTAIDGAKVEMVEYSDADGILSEGDAIWIEGHEGIDRARYYDLMDKGFPRDNVHWRGLGILVLTSQGGQIEHADQLALRYATPFHGLEFMHDLGYSNRWSFIGPDERAVQGNEAETRLNALANRYAVALEEAATHISSK